MFFTPPFGFNFREKIKLETIATAVHCDMGNLSFSVECFSGTLNKFQQISRGDLISADSRSFRFESAAARSRTRGKTKRSRRRSVSVRQRYGAEALQVEECF